MRGGRTCGSGLDICYENHFFAAENGVPIPESVMITKGLVKEGEDLSNVRPPCPRIRALQPAVF